MATTSEFAVQDIRPNPFRRMDRYPINEEKVAALQESIRTTGYWDNVVARMANGSAEIAYGHHRLAALKNEFGGAHRVTLILRDLDDTMMLKIMARENMEEWGHNVAVEHETIRAVVEAFAAGKVKLSEVPSNTNIKYRRYAPSFIGGTPDHSQGQLHEYTLETLADFLGWTTKTVNRAKGWKPALRVARSLNALELIERKVLVEKDFDGLNKIQAESVIREAKKALTRHKGKPAAKQTATKVGKAVAKSLKSGEKGHKQAADIANKVDPTPKEKPDIIRFAQALEDRIIRLLNDDDYAEKLDEILNFQEFLDGQTRKDLAYSLRKLADRAGTYAALIDNPVNLLE